MSRAYYNEFEPHAADWLETLILLDLIAPGDVDRRSIEDVTPNDLRGYTQCHFFAGIGGWSLALRLAGWPDSRPVWTGSCPCQPFSAAGQGKGTADERHLWPAWYWLIAQCRPRRIFGEQVEAAIKHDWLDLVQSDLEGIGYAVGPVGIPAAGVGAPHGRARLWFVADDDGHGRSGLEASRLYGRWEGTRGGESEAREVDGTRGDDAVRCGATGRLADGSGARLEGCDSRAVGHEFAAAERSGSAGGLGEPAGSGCERQRDQSAHSELVQTSQDATVAGPINGFWRSADWLGCRDGKFRPVEPGTFPLAHGVPARVGRLRAYGNAIVAPAAAEIIRAYLDVKAV